MLIDKMKTFCAPRSPVESADDVAGDEHGFPHPTPVVRIAAACDGRINFNKLVRDFAVIHMSKQHAFRRDLALGKKALVATVLCASVEVIHGVEVLICQPSRDDGELVGYGPELVA